MTLTQRPARRAAGGRPLFDGIDAAGPGAARRAGDEVDVPGGPRHRPAGRDRDRLLRRRRRARSGSSATARSSPTSVPGEFFGELSVLDGMPRNARSSPTARRPAWPSRRGTSRRSLPKSRAVALAILRGLAGACAT